MGVIIDFSTYKNRNCTNCQNTVRDDFLNLPVCTALLSDFRNQVVNKEIVCSCYIRKE